MRDVCMLNNRTSKLTHGQCARTARQPVFLAGGRSRSVADDGVCPPGPITARSARSTPPLVDTHAHVFRRDLPFRSGSGHRFDRDWTDTDYLAALDANGVRFGVVVGASFLGTYSDYTLQALGRSGRLRGTVIVDPDVDDARLDALDAAGIRGIRLSVGNDAAPPDLGSPAYRSLLGRLRERGWHVHFFARPEHTQGIIDGLVSARVNFVIDHFGARDPGATAGSAIFTAIERALQTGRAWVKLSGPYWSDRLDHAALARRFRETAGAGRLLWGSDWPFTRLDGRLRYGRTIDWLAEWVPDPADRAAMDRAAIKLFRFPEATAHA